MEKIKYFISWLGEKLFPDLPERKRQRIVLQIIAGISLALVSMAGMGIFRYRAAKQLEKYQAIAEVYAQTDTILEKEEKKSQQEAERKLQGLFQTRKRMHKVTGRRRSQKCRKTA